MDRARLEVFSPQLVQKRPGVSKEQTEEKGRHAGLVFCRSEAIIRIRRKTIGGRTESGSGEAEANGKSERRTKIDKEQRRIYNNQFQKVAYKRLVVKLSKKKDMDLMRFLNQKDNVTTYIKELIRADMQEGRL